VDGLKEAGFTVYLAHTTAIKKYEGLKHSGDKADARYLAHFLRLGILPTGTILEPEHREIRDLTRKRMQLVRSRTTHILAVENITARQNCSRITSNQVKQLTAEMVDAMALATEVALAVKTNVAMITTLSQQIDLLEKRLLVDMKARPDYTLLTSVPGIGKVLATIILLETGPIDRFKAAGNFASYARCVDSVHSSLRNSSARLSTYTPHRGIPYAHRHTRRNHGRRDTRGHHAGDSQKA
jgi:transposase